MTTFGENLSKVLEKIENTLWSFEVEIGTPPNFTNDGLRAATKIFASCLIDKIWNLQEDENMSMEDRSAMVEKAGNDLKKLVKIYTNIDTTDLYK